MDPRPAPARGARRIGTRIFTAGLSPRDHFDIFSPQRTPARRTEIIDVAVDPKRIAQRQYNPTAPWRIEDSLDLYHVHEWGKGYFGINETGHVVVRPDTQPGSDIDLYEVIEGLQLRDLATPVVVRFSDILAHRLKHLHDAFA
jgi:arginine decarboxylase-like protein